MCKISVIVPVYNTEQYLPRCLDSIISQSFTDFELLLVDDGSTDGSGLICDSYADRDRRIRVFHKENGGVSSARNLGLENARGEWVYFVDSDDALKTNGLQILVNGISDEIDVVMGGYEKYVENRLVESAKKFDTCVLTKNQSLMSLYHGHSLHYYYIGYLWMRLLRMNVVRRYGICFNPHLRVKEDTLFIVQYLCRSKGMTRFISDPVYCYYWRENSAMAGWRQGFDYKYVDSFFALIRMKQEIKSVSLWFSNIVYVAKDGIWVRYTDIKSKMEKCGMTDLELSARMKSEMIKELGVFFFFQKTMRTIKKKVVKLIS